MSGDLELEESLTIGTGSSGDDYIYMADGDEYLRWDVSPGVFFLSDNLYVRNSLQVGWTSSPKDYSVFGSGGTNHSDDITGESDVLVAGDLEINGKVFIDSAELYLGTASGTDDDYIYMDSGFQLFGWKNDLDEDSTNGTDGGFYFSDELSVAGDITAGVGGNFQYISPRTRYLNIPAIAFIKHEAQDTAAWLPSFSGYRYLSNSGSRTSCNAYAPVYLPTGATVEKVTVKYRDSSSESITIGYVLKAVGIYGFLSPADRVWSLSSGSTTSSNTTVIADASTTEIDEESEVIESNRSYWMELDWEVSALSAGANLKFYGAKIQYSIDELQ